MIQQRHQEHVQRCGDSECEWAFDDGCVTTRSQNLGLIYFYLFRYREGFDGRRCMKPPQQSAPHQPNTTPATQPPSAPVSQPNNPPANPNPQNSATNTPATHQCTAECNQGKGCQHTTVTPTSGPSKNDGNCGTKTDGKNGADSDSDHDHHHCSGECKHHKKKTGLLHKLEHKIEHALKLD
jgi:hypothetical protein